MSDERANSVIEWSTGPDSPDWDFSAVKPDLTALGNYLKEQLSGFDRLRWVGHHDVADMTRLLVCWIPTGAPEELRALLDLPDMLITEPEGFPAVMRILGAEAEEAMAGRSNVCQGSDGIDHVYVTCGCEWSHPTAERGRILHMRLCDEHSRDMVVQEGMLKAVARLNALTWNAAQNV